MPISFDEYLPGGPNPNFDIYHIWKCYDLLKEKGPLGRRTIAKHINLGEGSTRTLLSKMVKEGCVEDTKRGAVLTLNGEMKLRETGMSILPFDCWGLKSTDFTCTVLVKNKANRITDGCEQRDHAVRSGAEGAITLIARDGRLVFPEDDRYPDKSISDAVRTVNDILDGDVVIIGCGSTYLEAEKGAITAALALCAKTKGCWNEGRSLFSADTEEEDVKCIALAIHELVGRLPVTMRTKNHYGVRCEDGQIKETNYTGPVLEETFRKGKILRHRSKAGKYRGVPVLAVPFVRDKETIAVVGVFDVTKGSYAEWLGKTRKRR
jgi:hypothetical protein